MILQEIKRPQIFRQLIANLFLEHLLIGLFCLFDIAQLIIQPILHLLRGHRQELVLPIDDVAPVENDLIGLEELCRVLLLNELYDRRLLHLIDLNLFYRAFVLEKRHQLVRRVVRSRDVLHVNRVLLLAVVVVVAVLVVVVIVIVLVLRVLRALVVLLLLWVAVVTVLIVIDPLGHRGRGYPWGVAA